MPQIPTQQTPGSRTNQQKSKRKSRPEIICVWISLVWIVVCVHLFHSHQSRQPTIYIENAPDIVTNKIAEDATLTHDGIKSRNNTDSTQFNNNQSNKNNDPFPDHYMVFSTACSAYQDWQSFLFFYYAHKVSQPGNITRIASGCSIRQQQKLASFHANTISKLSPSFGIHFTPEYGKISGEKDYKYYNKPFGLQHWFQHGLGDYDYDSDRFDNAIIMVLDPDMILLRPLTYDFTDSNVLLHNIGGHKGPPKVWKVMHGQPWASHYSFGDGPFKIDLGYVFENRTDSPALNVTQEDQFTSFTGGPPYMATGRDMFAIVNVWCELVTRVHHVYNQLLGEMFAWSLAAAHLELPHRLVDSFMVSNVNGLEGWPLIDELRQDEVCDTSAQRSVTDKLPYVLHYCQMYWVGDWMVSKYNIGNSFFSCKTPLLVEPPMDTGPLGEPRGIKKRRIKPTTLKREQFMVCQLILRLNEAVIWFKNQTCGEGDANYEKIHMLPTL